ncbi:MAG: hypothetical protein RM021_018670 [Nostoc sp. EkiNYC01]|nr:hypothetical protein [Nostoc sp. EkiNYC01]
MVALGKALDNIRAIALSEEALTDAEVVKKLLTTVQVALSVENH